MRFTLSTLHEIARAAGVPDPKGIPLSALVAAMALEESKGDPRGAKGDVRHGQPTSFGILQVHEPSWPEIARKTRALSYSLVHSDYGVAVAEVALVKPILEDAARQAVAAADVLQTRGFTVGPIELLLLIDAAWQGPIGSHWPENTSTGDPAEIRQATAPGRTGRVRAHLAELGVDGGGSWVTGLLTVLGLGGATAMFIWALGEWEG